MKLKDFSTIELLDELRRRELTKDVDDSISTELCVGSHVMVVNCWEQYSDETDDEGYHYKEHIGRTGVVIYVSDDDVNQYEIRYDNEDFDTVYWNADELEVIK